MSNKRYLEVTSAYRDRNKYPNPAEFVIPFHKADASSNGLNAVDYVADSYPYYGFHGCPTNAIKVTTTANEDTVYFQVFPVVNNFGVGAPDAGRTLMSGTITGGTPEQIILDDFTTAPAHATIIGLKNISAAEQAGGINDYFAGALLVIVTGDPRGNVVQPGTGTSAIGNWNKVGSSRIASYNASTNTCTLVSALDLGRPMTTHRYFIVFDQIDEQSGTIRPYNPTGLYGLATSATGLPAGRTPFWSEPGLTNGINTTFELFINGGSFIDNFYVGNTVEHIGQTWTAPTTPGAATNSIPPNGSAYLEFVNMQNPPTFSKITKYNGLTRIATLQTALTDVQGAGATHMAWTTMDNYIIRKTNPRTWGFGQDNAAAVGGGVVCIVNGCVYSVEIQNPGTGYTIGPDIATTGGTNSLTVNILSIGPNGEILSVEVFNSGCFLPPPTGGYTVGNIVTVNTGTGGTLVITGVGQGIGINSLNSSGISLSRDSYKGDKIYIPDSSNNYMDSVTNIQQVTGDLPLNPVNYNQVSSSVYSPTWPESNLIQVNPDPFYAQPSTLPPKVSNTSVNPIPETGARTILASLGQGPSFGDGAGGAGAGNFVNLWLIIEGNYPLAVQNAANSTVGPLTSSLYYQILPFTRDNYDELDYSGSIVSQQQEVCYEIELLDLILPNLTLKNVPGAIIAFYPFVYVSLSNFGSGRNTNIIYSNNHNAWTALFRVAIKDITRPLISAFIKNNGNGAVQTVKFKPNDDLFFRVYFGNGQTFETKISDQSPPVHPDPFVQISAMFSMKRL